MSRFSERTQGLGSFGEKTGFYVVGVFLIWLFHRILWWGIAGYVVYYILGGTTAIYFQLRRDVDGTEESEIYLEDGEEDEFDFSVGEPPAPPAEPEASATEAAPAEAPAEEAPAAEEEPSPDAPESEGDDEEKKPEGEG